MHLYSGCSHSGFKRRGQIIDGITQTKYCLFPLQDEVVALLITISLAKSKKLAFVIFESASEVLVKAINKSINGRSDQCGPWSFQAIIASIWEMF